MAMNHEEDLRAVARELLWELEGVPPNRVISYRRNRPVTVAELRNDLKLLTWRGREYVERFLLVRASQSTTRRQ